VLLLLENSINPFGGASDTLAILLATFDSRSRLCNVESSHLRATVRSSLLKQPGETSHHVVDGSFLRNNSR
jgi:hypothetical protein